MPLVYEYPLTKDDLPVFPGVSSHGWNVLDATGTRRPDFKVFLKPSGSPEIKNLPEHDVCLPVLLLQAIPVDGVDRGNFEDVRLDVHEVMDIIFRNCKSPVRVDRIEIVESPSV